MKRLFVIAAAGLGLSACGQETPAASSNDAAADEQIIHEANAERGRQLFVDKGCVICHAVNGVGGKAAPALDAAIGAPRIDPLEFAARMWRGAPAMIELQSIELGYTIYLEADDIADIAAFAADRDEQSVLTIDDLPETTRNGLLDERFWEMENWDDFLSSGQESDYPDEPEDAPLDVE